MKKFVMLMSLLMASTFSVANDTGSWKFKQISDEMSSKVIKVLDLDGEATRTLDFPYGDVQVGLFYYCDQNTYMFYTTASNLTDGEWDDYGYQVYKIRIKLDDSLGKASLIQTSSASDTFGVYNSLGNSKYDLGSYDTVLIETSLYSQGIVVYRFNTSGIDAAIAKHCN